MDMIDKDIAEGYVQICKEVGDLDDAFATDVSMVGLGFLGWDGITNRVWIKYERFQEFLKDPETYVCKVLIEAFKEHIRMIKENRVSTNINKRMAQEFINELEGWLD